jgi:hypothetical protein
MLSALIWLTLACPSPSASYDSPEACAALSAGDQRDECWSLQAVALFQANRNQPDVAEQIIAEQVSSPDIQDFIWLEVTKGFAPQSYRYCERIQNGALKDRCKTIVSRPHLHRELLQAPEGGANQPGSGGPPPGGAPPTGGGAPPPPQ